MYECMILSWISKLVAGTIGGVIAFLVALFPEHIKERESLSGFRSDAAHFFSGIAECLFALALFVYSYDQFIGGLIMGTSRALAAGSVQASIAEGQMRGIGVLGYVMNLLNPVALISFYLFFEGGVRAASAVMTGRHYGIGAFWAIHKITILARTKQRAAILRRQLGPEEPDSLFKDKTSGVLVLTSIENKPWRERQVARYGSDLYILSAKNFVPMERHYRYRYSFRRMHPGEIIRGAVAVIPFTACRR
jgi:hypothetical protein